MGKQVARLRLLAPIARRQAARAYRAPSGCSRLSRGPSGSPFALISAALSKSGRPVKDKLPAVPSLELPRLTGLPDLLYHHAEGRRGDNPLPTPLFASPPHTSLAQSSAHTAS